MSKQKIPFEWEEIDDLSCYQTYRAAVFGGWIVGGSGYLDGELKTDSLVFIPDVNHDWEIG